MAVLRGVAIKYGDCAKLLTLTVVHQSVCVCVCVCVCISYQ